MQPSLVQSPLSDLPASNPGNAGKALQLLLQKIQVVFDFASAGGKGTEILGPLCAVSQSTGRFH